MRAPSRSREKMEGIELVVTFLQREADVCERLTSSPLLLALCSLSEAAVTGNLSNTAVPSPALAAENRPYGLGRPPPPTLLSAIASKSTLLTVHAGGSCSLDLSRWLEVHGARCRGPTCRELSMMLENCPGETCFRLRLGAEMTLLDRVAAVAACGA